MIKSALIILSIKDAYTKQYHKTLNIFIAVMTFCLVMTLSMLSVLGDENKSMICHAKNLDDIHAASCRVFLTNGRSGAIGTGTVIGLADHRYWILTNWHVVQGFRSCELHFFRDGKIFKASGKIEAAWHNEKAPYDFAVITVPEKELQEYGPPVVPLAPEGTRPFMDRPILSAGCSEGRWALAWKGSVEDFYGDTAQFMPAPKQGQSGSSIVQNINGQLYVTGVLTWRVGDERTTSEENLRGGAIPISKFYDAVSGKTRINDKDSIPPHAVWTSSETTKTNVKGHNVKTLPVLRINGSETAATYDSLVLYVYSSNQCLPCQKAVPVLEKLKQEGYTIKTIIVETEEGKKSAKDFNIRQYPTFLLQRFEDETWQEKTRWAGINSLEERIRQAFSLYAVTAAGRIFPRQKRPDVTPSEKQKEPSEAENIIGNIAPLLDQYKEKKENESPDTLNDSKPKKSDDEKKQESINQESVPEKKKEDKVNDTSNEVVLPENLLKGFSGRLDRMTTDTETKLRSLTDSLEDRAIERMEKLIREKAKELEPYFRERFEEATKLVFEKTAELAKEKATELEPVLRDFANERLDRIESVFWVKFDAWLIQITPWFLGGIIVVSLSVQLIAKPLLMLAGKFLQLFLKMIPVKITIRARNEKNNATSNGEIPF